MSFVKSMREIKMKWDEEEYLRRLKNLSDDCLKCLDCAIEYGSIDCVGCDYYSTQIKKAAVAIGKSIGNSRSGG